MTELPIPTTPPLPLVTLEEVRMASRRLAPHLSPTPLLTSRSVSERVGFPLFLKGEHLQRTGSFKSRGALNALLAGAAEGHAGVVTVSAGNHAQAVAWAAAQAGLSATVVMPRGAPAVKVAASRGYGAKVVLTRDVGAAFAEAQRLAEEEDRFLLHPFDDRRVIAGQGTVGLELHEQLPSTVELLVVPVGGGGLLAGVAAALSALRPALRIVGVEPPGAAGMKAALKEGRSVRLASVDTVADGLAAPMAGNLPLAHVQRQVAAMELVDDARILEAMSLLLTRAKAVVEPAGAAGLGTLLAPSGTLGSFLPTSAEGGAATILCGGNVDPTFLSNLPL